MNKPKLYQENNPTTEDDYGLDYADVASSLGESEMSAEHQIISEAAKRENSTLPRIICFMASFAGFYSLYPENLSFILILVFSYGCLISSIHSHFTFMTCLLFAWFPLVFVGIA